MGANKHSNMQQNDGKPFFTDESDELKPNPRGNLEELHQVKCK